MECEISAVLTGAVAPFGPEGEPSGYRKTVRTGKVAVAAQGLAGDEQADLVHHGGTDKAIHHYALDHYPAWIAERSDLRDIFRQPGAPALLETGSSHWRCVNDEARDRNRPCRLVLSGDRERHEAQALLVHRQIASIDRALERIANGTYGECARCSGEIAPARPEAALCIDCARAEQ